MQHFRTILAHAHHPLTTLVQAFVLLLPLSDKFFLYFCMTGSFVII